MTGEGRTGEERTGQENPKTKKQLGLDVLVTCLVKIFKNPDNCKLFFDFDALFYNSFDFV